VVLTCYACKQAFTVTGWNPLQQFIRCPQLSCGRAVYVGEALEREHGKVVGGQAKAVIRGLSRVGDNGRSGESLAHLVELAARRIETLLKDPPEAVKIFKKTRSLRPLPGEVFA
jgi:hypothetical protein